MNVDDLKDLPEPSRTRAKTLLTCRQCNKYFDDPRVLPCRHSFCRKCLQTIHDDLQASVKPPSRRVGSMPCPTCRQPIGIPLTGIIGFPVDTKVGRIKELVVAEISKNLSKKMGGDTENSTTPSKKKKPRDDVKDSGGAEAQETEGRSTEEDFVAFSEKAGTGVGYKRNSAYPDFSKFARYFDSEGKPSETRPFKSRMAERHRVGYSNSFQHTRRKVPLRTKAFDDTDAELFLNSEADSRGGRDSSLGAGSRESTNDDSRSKYQRSRSARPSTSRRYHAMDEFDLGEESGEGEGEGFPRRREESPPGFSRPTGGSEFSRPMEADGEGDVFEVTTEGGGALRDRPKPRRSLHKEEGTDVKSSRSSRIKTSTLPTHKENISTEASGRYTGDREKGDKVREARKSGVHFGDEKSFSSGPKMTKTPTREPQGPNFESKHENINQSRQERSGSSSGRSRKGSRDGGSKESPQKSDAGAKSAGRKKVDFSDERQAPGTSSSYQTGRRTHDIVDIDIGEGNHSESIKETEKPKRNKPVFDMPPTRTPTAEEIKRSEKKREKKSSTKMGENVSENLKPHRDASNEEFKVGQTEEGGEPEVSKTGRRRTNKPERLQRKEAERKSHPLPDFDIPSFPKQDVPYRSKEQIRNDARRNFSMRIKEVFDEYKKHHAKDDETATGGDDQNEKLSEGNVEKNMKKSKKDSDEKKKNDEEKKEEDVDDKPGRNWEELINNARAKYNYSAEQVDKIPVSREELICGDDVFPRWRLQKAEYGIPTSMAITSKGCVIVAEYGLGCVEFYDETGALTHSMEGLKPFSVVVNDKDQVIVGDRKGKAVRIFDEYGGDVGHWDATVFNWICGIAIMPGSTSGQLVIYDRERCKLGVYSPPGELVREFSSSFGSNDSQLCMADFLAVDSHGRVLVADSANHCIKVFDSSTGSFLKKFGSRGEGDGCLDWPKGICVDSADNIIVSDVHNKRVSMFSSDGKFMQHLVSGISNPYSVCYSDAIKAIGITQYSQDGTSQYDLYGLQS